MKYITQLDKSVTLICIRLTRVKAQASAHKQNSWRWLVWLETLTYSPLTTLVKYSNRSIFLESHRESYLVNLAYAP